MSFREPAQLSRAFSAPGLRETLPWTGWETRPFCIVFEWLSWLMVAYGCHILECKLLGDVKALAKSECQDAFRSQQPACLSTAK